MKVLVIGGGGREHALCRKLKQSSKVSKLFAAPGNDGIAQIAQCAPDIKATDIDKLVNFARDNGIDLTVVGPDDPLALGIVDHFRKKKLRVYGPTGSAARLESSKGFAKDVMRRHAIPTAGHKIYDKPGPASEYLKNCDYPVVIKADGLAAGKGVTICHDVDEGEAAVKEMMIVKRFGEAGRRVLIEDFLQGEEISVHAITDGRTILSLCLAQDHKRALDGDKGENTGGMGTYSPLPQVSEEVQDQIQDEIMVRTVHAMNRDETPFSGTLFVGVMLTKLGPKVIEYNARFGDPETQTIMARMQGDLFDVLWAATEGNLDSVDVEWDPRAAVTVVLASGGYPREFEKGYKIHGLENDFGPDVTIYHAGTKRVGGEWFTNGGRVLNVTALGTDLVDARKKAYAAIEKIRFDKMFYRKDIGWRALK
ncbi:MAG: phosphoribosylamine--glycine ligase [Planctomycetes bacterium]|nr:phosphoribosylamine--glycine ligase [Planctomycetota bacterium]